ncbi:MAG: hypothetical protein HYX61_10210 [Gammaproteobacteria bacterium]|jgi:hypothetical protein|nr:hypothetical protein [Gammaproteobacteria bacterium]
MTVDTALKNEVEEICKIFENKNVLTIIFDPHKEVRRASSKRIITILQLNDALDEDNLLQIIEFEYRSSSNIDKNTQEKIKIIISKLKEIKSSEFTFSLHLPNMVLSSDFLLTDQINIIKANKGSILEIKINDCIILSPNFVKYQYVAFLYRTIFFLLFNYNFFEHDYRKHENLWITLKNSYAPSHSHTVPLIENENLFLSSISNFKIQEEENVKKFLTKYLESYQKQDENLNKIILSINCWYESYIRQINDEYISITMLTAGLDAIFGDEKNNKKIVQKMLGFSIANSLKERAEIESIHTKLYESRNSIVHGKAIEKPLDFNESMSKMREYLTRAILYEINVYLNSA